MNFLYPNPGGFPLPLCTKEGFPPRSPSTCIGLGFFASRSPGGLRRWWDVSIFLPTAAPRALFSFSSRRRPGALRHKLLQLLIRPDSSLSQHTHTLAPRRDENPFPGIPAAAGLTETSNRLSYVAGGGSGDVLKVMKPNQKEQTI